MARILTVTSGKGGVGKTNISVNLAVLLSRQGHRTCLFDADLGLANINILLGIYPEHNLEDVIDGTKSLKEIVIHDQSGIDIVPGSSGVAKMEGLSTAQLGNLTDAFLQLEDYDYLIFDTSAGISKNVIAFCMNASEVILVVTPEPTSLTDAYALMKILYLNGFRKTAKVVVNQSKNPKTAQLAISKLKETVQKFLGIALSPLGTVVSDARVIEAVAAQKPFISLYPNAPAAKCLKAVAAHLLEEKIDPDETFSMETFWHKCIDILTVPLKIPVKKGESTPNKGAPAAAAPAPTAPAPQAEPVVAAAPQRPDVSPYQEDKHHQLLEKLIQSVAGISGELSRIRKLLERDAGIRAGGDHSEKGGNGAPIIPLDFEAFLAKHKSGD